MHTQITVTIWVILVLNQVVCRVRDSQDILTLSNRGVTPKNRCVIFTPRSPLKKTVINMFDCILKFPLYSNLLA